MTATLKKNYNVWVYIAHMFPYRKHNVLKKKKIKEVNYFKKSRWQRMTAKVSVSNNIFDKVQI